VIVTSRRAERAQELADNIATTFGTRTLGVALDVTSLDSIAALMERLHDWSEGRVDVLVNNAGLPVISELWDTPFHDIPFDEINTAFDRVSNVDLAGARAMTRALLPGMRARRHGAIVYISSTPALAGHHATPYTVAKAGLLGLMRDTARNYAADGILANAVAPGNIKTSWFDKVSAGQQQALAEEAPMRRWGHPSEVAQAILFLASPQSSFVTGQVLVIDGGVVIR